MLNNKENKKGNTSNHYYMRLAIVIDKDTSSTALIVHHHPDPQSLGSPGCREDLENQSWQLGSLMVHPIDEVSRVTESRSSL